MNTNEFKAQYSEAGRLYSQGDYAGALGILKRLDAASPNNGDVMYAQVRCHVELEQYDEARGLATRLSTQLGDHRGQELLAQLPHPTTENPRAAEPKRSPDAPAQPSPPGRFSHLEGMEIDPDKPLPPAPILVDSSNAAADFSCSHGVRSVLGTILNVRSFKLFSFLNAGIAVTLILLVLFGVWGLASDGLTTQEKSELLRELNQALVSCGRSNAQSLVIRDIRLVKKGEPHYERQKTRFYEGDIVSKDSGKLVGKATCVHMPTRVREQLPRGAYARMSFEFFQ